MCQTKIFKLWGNMPIMVAALQSYVFRTKCKNSYSTPDIYRSTQWQTEEHNLNKINVGIYLFDMARTAHTHTSMYVTHSRWCYPLPSRVSRVVCMPDSFALSSSTVHCSVLHTIPLLSKQWISVGFWQLVSPLSQHVSLSVSVNEKKESQWSLFALTVNGDFIQICTKYLSNMANNKQ